MVSFLSSSAGTDCGVQAFDSPLLSDYNSNSSARNLAYKVQGFQVRYGVLAADSEGTASKLGFGEEAEAIVQPQRSNV